MERNVVAQYSESYRKAFVNVVAKALVLGGVVEADAIKRANELATDVTATK